MHKELEVMKPRCNGLWKRCTGTAAFDLFLDTGKCAGGGICER